MALIRDCAICKAHRDLHADSAEVKPAIYDGKTFWGPWAYMCEEHWNSEGNKAFPPTLLENVLGD